MTWCTDSGIYRAAEQTRDSKAAQHNPGFFSHLSEVSTRCKCCCELSWPGSCAGLACGAARHPPPTAPRSGWWCHLRLLGTRILRAWLQVLEASSNSFWLLDSPTASSCIQPLPRNPRNPRKLHSTSRPRSLPIGCDAARRTLLSQAGAT